MIVRTSSFVSINYVVLSSGILIHRAYTAAAAFELHMQRYDTTMPYPRPSTKAQVLY